jgi:hypothetical protein
MLMVMLGVWVVDVVHAAGRCAGRIFRRKI